MGITSNRLSERSFHHLRPTLNPIFRSNRVIKCVPVFLRYRRARRSGRKQAVVAHGERPLFRSGRGERGQRTQLIADNVMGEVVHIKVVLVIAKGICASWQIPVFRFNRTIRPIRVEILEEQKVSN